MALNILGVNPGHNGSVALVSDGKVLYYIEEERLSRQKYDGNPFRAILDVLNKWHVDVIVIGGTISPPKLPWTGEDPYTALVRKFNPLVKTVNLFDEHHLGHAACAFYNSGFDKAIAVIVDGAGSFKTEKITNAENNETISGYETESIWVCDYPCKFEAVYKVYADNIGVKYFDTHYEMDNAVTLTKSYEAVSHYLGFGFIEAGKTMGLSSYGKKDDNIPNLFLGNRTSKDLFIPHYPAGAFIDQNRIEIFRRTTEPTAWHKDPSLLTDIEKNLAWKIQDETQNVLASYIEKAVSATGLKKVVIAGGYGLNCVANYYLQKRFPDLEFYFEPIAHDGGTAIGIAKLIWYEHLQKEQKEFSVEKQTSIYYGSEYSLPDIKQILEENEKTVSVKKVSYKEIAELISNKNIVSIFQGRSEAGPRALGNRSILYDPRDENGKEFVNLVKGREWFRPFAGSVLKEDANDWFDMAGAEESPFMMMAVNVAADKITQVPCITHVDGTCRIQTVSSEQNPHYYNLIKAFKEITGVPVLFNTSFNLAGDPLVENIFDALNTLFNSKLKYMYLPELELLVTKTIENPGEFKEEPNGDEVIDDVVAKETLTD
jgi:carbamoyltransferase